MKKEIDDTKDIIMLGDSIIEWFRRAKYKNFGHAGYTTRDVLWYLEDYTFITGEIVILMIGVNDLLCDFKSELSEKYYNEILRILDKKFNKILLIKLLPTNSVLINGGIIKFNKFIDKISQGNNKIYILDIYNNFLNKEKNIIDDLYTTDGIHLSNKGYEEFIKLLEDKINYIKINNI